MRSPHAVSKANFIFCACCTVLALLPPRRCCRCHGTQPRTMEIIATAISRALPGGSREVQPVNAEERQSAAVAIERAWRQRSWRTLLRRWRYCRTLAGNVQLHNPLDPAHASLMLVLQRPTPESATRMERHRDAFFRLLIRHPGIANVYTWMSLGSVVELKVVTLWLGAYHPVSDASCESPHPSNEPLSLPLPTHRPLRRQTWS